VSNKYDSYKDSGVEWIGDIPNHWHVKRLKNIGSLYSGLSGKSGSDFEKVPTENFKPFINFTNIANNKYIVGDNFGFVKIDENENQNQVKKNDLFFLMSSENQEDVGKSALLLNDYDELYLNSFCKGFRLTINSDARFINYLLSSSALSQLISLEGRGFTRINLRMEGVENLPIILPQSIEEQTTIANYLDHKTTQIDHLIAKKVQFIQLLEEERVAVINQAVTKGLDNSVHMKDSGIEWLGEIPEHWEVKKLKLLANIQGRIGFKGYTVGDLVSEGEGALTLGAKHIDKFNKLNLSNPEFISWDKYYESPEIMVQIGDIILTQRGTLGKVVLITDDIGKATINPSMVILSNLKANDYFLYYFFNSDYFKSWIDLTNTATAVPMISQGQLGNLKLVLPNNDEQKHIARSIQKSTKKIDDIIVKAQQEIDLLKEYKTALISEVVTGKVDVSTSSTQVLETKN
jgi:type I restriction enzyme S subunit